MHTGCHVSIAGGIINAPERASVLGCEVFQMFTRSPQGGPAPKITDEIAKDFRNKMEKFGQENCYIHTPYYINFASAKETTRKASARIVGEELERGTLIGAKYVMTHLGSSAGLTASSAKELGKDEALKMTAEGIEKILNDYSGTTELLLEISAGAGEIIGDTFEELSQILGYMEISKRKKVGICLDSAHMFASGYDIKSEDGFKKVVDEIKKTVGLDKIKLIHANDSKVGLGERKDRHDHIGDGKIGKEGFINLMRVFSEVDLICETQPDKVENDILILKKLRSLKV